MKSLFTFLVFSLLSIAAFSAEALKVKSDKTPIFKSNAGEEKKGELAAGELLYLLKKGPQRTMVRTGSGLKGWVENSVVEYTKASRGDVYNLDAQEVTGWLDNPATIYILDNTSGADDALPLSRSFRDEILEKQDREEIERSNDEN